MQAGLVTEYDRELARVLRMPAATPEDYLFRGYAESQLDPDRALASLDEAVRQRPSVLAQLIRLDALRMHILDNPDLEKAREALDDIQSIKRQFPDNAMVRALSITVYTTCYHVFGELRQPALRQTALELGMKEAPALAKDPDSVDAAWRRWLFLNETGQEEVGIAALRRTWERTTDARVGYFYSLYLYAHADFQQAVMVTKRCKDECSMDFLRVIALAETEPQGHALASRLHKDIAARDLTGWDLFNSQLVLRFLGRKKEAREISHRFLQQPQHFPPVRQGAFRNALEYCAEQLPADRFIASMGGKRGDLCNAHLCIALTALADGDRAGARRHLQLCVDTHFYEFFPYDLSRLWLSRMASDPTWPPWIKPVK
jgi:hypothetical protein